MVLGLIPTFTEHFLMSSIRLLVLKVVDTNGVVERCAIFKLKLILLMSIESTSRKLMAMNTGVCTPSTSSSYKGNVFWSSQMHDTSGI